METKKEKVEEVVPAKTYKTATVPKPQENDAFDDGGHWPRIIHNSTKVRRHHGW